MIDKVSKLYLEKEVRVQFDTEQIGDVWVVRITGRLDFENHHYLRSEIEWILQNDKNVLLFNLSKVDAMSSSGAGAFVDLYHKLKKTGGRFALADISKPCRHSLELLRLLEFFPIFETESEALAALNEK